MNGKFNVLVVGSGGREHAICWKLKNSFLLKNLYSFPGNGGISRIAEVIDLDFNFENLKKIISEKNIDIVVVGPEAPLVNGISDFLENENVIVFGPNKKASTLEGSKVFAKEFMKKYKIPTADFEIFDDKNKAIDYLKTKNEIVLKADGLCAGKGVFVCNNFEESREATLKIMEEKIFGQAGDRIVVEEKLKGEEASVLVLLNEDIYIPLIPAQDHKPIFENDLGPNTGGMGSYAPTKLIDKEIFQKIEEKIIKRVVEGLKREKIKYKGVLYLGLMIVDKEPFVLEFNVRFGDPETQSILPLLENDLLEIILNLEKKEKIELRWNEGVCLDVVIASKGYPGKYEKGKEIKIKEDKEILVFHAGTIFKDGKFYTSGGRVLNICGVEKDIKEARKKVYKFIEENVYFDGMFYRKDIGLKEERRTIR